MEIGLLVQYIVQCLRGVIFMAESRKSTKKVAENWKKVKKICGKLKKRSVPETGKLYFASRKTGKLENGRLFLKMAETGKLF